MALPDAVVAAEFKPSRRALASGNQPISELMARALANPDLISLAAGFVDQETLPAEITRQALTELLADDDEARAVLQYGTTPGFRPLREALLARADCGPSNPTIDQVVITAGSSQFLHLLAEAILDPGDIVLCASPTYLVFLSVIANVDARAIGVRTDDQGIVPEALEATLQQLDASGELSRVKAIYMIPYYDNPCGITMPFDRVSAAVELAKRWSRENRIHVIADEAYRELRYSRDDVPSALNADDDGDTVVITGTFSKPYSPGVRVGWGILPEHLIDPICGLKGNMDFGSPNLNQHLMAKVLESGVFDGHVQRVRAGYQAKRDAMLAAADEHLAPIAGVDWIRPDGGLYVWARMPGNIDTGPDGDLFDACVKEGVIYVPGQYFYSPEGEPVRRDTMRLSFGVQTCERIHEGIAALARAIRKVS